MENNKVIIDWGKYGNYELEFDATNREMHGCKVGQPENWRKAVFLKPLAFDSTSVSTHEHCHHH